jgi:hypothetical protein
MDSICETCHDSRWKTVNVDGHDICGFCLDNVLAAIRARVTELEAVVAKLPKDAERNPRIPFVDNLWTINRGHVRKLEWCKPLPPYRGFSGADGHDQCSVPYMQTFACDNMGDMGVTEDGVIPIAECYSTKEAAQAAKASASKETT